jgi:hypothetical protein
MNDRLRILLGVILLVVGFFYPRFKAPAMPDKLDRPEDYIVALVERLPEISDPVDSNMLAGTFFAMSEGVLVTDLKTNLQVQYFLDKIGKTVMGNALVSESGEKKYPTFSPVAAKLIEETIGPQTETDPLTVEEVKNLSKLFYGFSWKLYDKSEDSVFEEYRIKADTAIAEYNNNDEDPEPEVNTECICEGKGYVIHGDGHKTDCPCVESGEDCKHDPKCKSKGEAPPVEEPCEEAQCPAPNKTTKRRGIFGWRK